ncbi:MAG: hypothetical protein IPP52_09410 [Ignavibacteria bacterium]|nr:hypothetical protein [Ignavibacteria bacterium]
MVSDTAIVLLRNSASPYSVIDSAKSVLNSNGTGTFLFNNSSNDVGYYLPVKHRNSIETWSASPQSFIGSVLSYAFTSAAAQAFGSNMKLVEGKWCFYSGDINQDGTIDASDLSDADNDATSR